MKIDELNYLISGYLGIKLIDEYELQAYILKEINDLILTTIKEKKIKNYDLEYEKERIDNEYTILEKLNDSLLVLKKIKAPMELILIIKSKIKDLKKEQLINNTNKDYL